MEWPVGDATQHGAILGNNGAAAVAPVHDQASDVLLGHVGQLLTDGVLQTDQPACQQEWTISAYINHIAFLRTEQPARQHVWTLNTDLLPDSSHNCSCSIPHVLTGGCEHSLMRCTQFGQGFESHA